MPVDASPNPGITIAEIYTINAPELRRFALSLARDADRADDLVSDTMLRAMAHLSLLGQLNPYQRRAWLYRTLKNRFLDEQRARQREQALLEQMTLLEMALSPMCFHRICWLRRRNSIVSCWECVFCLG